MLARFTRLFSKNETSQTNSNEFKLAASSSNDLLKVEAIENGYHAKISSSAEEKTTKSCDFWLSSQFLYTWMDMFMSTSYPIALFVTDIFNFKQVFLQVSYPGVAAAVPLALGFSYSEAICHEAQSEVFNKAGENHKSGEMNSDTDLRRQQSRMEEGLTSSPPESKSSRNHLSYKQKLAIAGHYVADAVRGAQVPLFMVKMAPREWSDLELGLIYLGLGLYGCWGNYQELKNTITAFHEKNEEEVSRRAGPR